MLMIPMYSAHVDTYRLAHRLADPFNSVQILLMYHLQALLANLDGLHKTRESQCAHLGGKRTFRWKWDSNPLIN